MRRYSAAHPRSTKALFATVAVAVALRLGSVPFLNLLNATAWKGFDAGSWRSFQTTWQAAALVGLLLVASVAGIVLVRFRELHKRRILSD